MLFVPLDSVVDILENAWQELKTMKTMVVNSTLLFDSGITFFGRRVEKKR